MYLLFLLVSLSGLAVLDWRYKLCFFYDRRRTAKTLGMAVGIFIIWDILGIAKHIFFIGNTHYLTGVKLLPQFPLEELFFLSLLTYTALMLWRILETRWPRI